MPSPNLSLPYLVVSQAQKEVTHNDALNALDALVLLAVTNATTSTPPVSPANGDRYIVGPSASGAWLGKDKQIAAWFSGWQFFAPAEGWLCYDRATDKVLVYDGAAWAGLPGGPGSVIKAADGTVALPGIAFDADTDTGLYRVGANDLGIVTAGTLRLRVDPSGIVRLVSGNIILGGSGSGGLVLGGTYVQIKSDDGGARIQIGKSGTDNRILLELFDTAGGSAVVVRDSGGAEKVAFSSDGKIKIAGTQVVEARQTGWGAPTGTATRTAFDTTTVTVAQLAERVKALIDDLRTHGLINN